MFLRESCLVFFNFSLNLAIRSSEPQSTPGLVFDDLYRTSPSLAAKNIINLILVLIMWWCLYVVFSCVVGRGCLLWPVCYLGRTLLVFALLHSVLQGQICLLLQVFNCGVGEDSWEYLGLQGDPTSQSSKKSVLNIHWKDWCWSWNSSTLATWSKELTHWKRPWCWERLKAGEEGDDRGWYGWMASSTQWSWVWVDSGNWWWTGRPGVLWFMGSQRVGQDWTIELNWTALFQSIASFFVVVVVVPYKHGTFIIHSSKKKSKYTGIALFL